LTGAKSVYFPQGTSQRWIYPVAMETNAVSLSYAWLTPAVRRLETRF
jgi:hypothetical protein